MESTTTLPRNYASTNLPASYPGSCFDLSDLTAFATSNPVDDFELDAEECPSTTPCSETNDADADTPLELTYSGSTSTSTSSTSRTASPPRTRIEQDDFIECVIRKLEGYSLGLDSRAKGNRERKSGLLGVPHHAEHENDYLLWSRVWGSAVAVRNAKERRGRRDRGRMGSEVVKTSS